MVRKIPAFILISFIFSLFFSFFSSKAYAACSATYEPVIIAENQPFTITIKGTSKNHDYNAFIYERGSRTKGYSSATQAGKATQDGQEFSYQVPGLKGGIYEFNAQSFDTPPEVCLKTEVEIKSASGGDTSQCVIWIGDNKTTVQPILKPGDNTVLHATGKAIVVGKKYIIDIASNSYNSGYTVVNEAITILNFPFSTNKADGSPLSTGSHAVTISSPPDSPTAAKKLLCSNSFAIGTPGAPAPTKILTPTPTPKSPLPPCKIWQKIGGDEKTQITDAVLKELEKKAYENNEPEPNKRKDYKCAIIDTGLGVDLPTDPVGFIKGIFSILLSIAGSIALILIIVSGYQIMFSQGDAEKLQGARETLTSAVVGLLFIIFSLAILQFIGVDLLHLPGFEP